MDSKWKFLIISILIYQIVLTITILNLHQYAHWLHFNASGHQHHSWMMLEGTAPMRSAVLWLGITAIVLLIANIIAFRKSARDKLPQQGKY